MPPPGPRCWGTSTVRVPAADTAAGGLPGFGVTQCASVRLFATFRDLAGADAISVPLEPGASVSDLRERLATMWPNMRGLLAKSAVAVNEEYAAGDREIRPGDDLALIPPVSGG
jgi:molybdopterin converting factor small subunit